MNLWLVRHLGDPVALVNETDRTAAVATARARLMPAAPAGEFTAALVGRPVEGQHGAHVVDLRPRVTPVAAPPPAPAPRPERPPPPEGVAAFLAACAAVNVQPESARTSRADLPTAVRHVTWLAMHRAGFDCRACGRVTGHHGSAAGKVVNTALVPEGDALVAYEAAVRALARQAEPSSPC
jgi:hypothetical protein